MTLKGPEDLARRDTERHLLLAVDESENSKRAVLYIADFFCDSRDVYVHLLSILPEPSEDYFPTAEARLVWIRERTTLMERALAAYREILLDAGFGEEKLTSRLVIRPCASIADAILEEQEELRCCIVVVGRRGISHQEEFVFGSTSSKILHQAKNFAVLVVE